jgi:hypothetical protein
MLQRAMAHENLGRNHKSYSRFKENNSRETEKHNVEVCVDEWVDTPKDKPISCTFLKPNVGWKEEISTHLTYQNATSCLAY